MQTEWNPHLMYPDLRVRLPQFKILLSLIFKSISPQRNLNAGFTLYCWPTATAIQFMTLCSVVSVLLIISRNEYQVQLLIMHLHNKFLFLLYAAHLSKVHEHPPA